MSKIKIARIVTVPIVYTHILDLLAFLSKDERFELHIVCSEGPFLGELKARLPTAHFHIIYIPRNIEIVNDFRALFSLVRLFKAEKFDIVHSHTPKGGLVTAMAGFLAGVKNRIHTFTGQIWANMKGPKKHILLTLDKMISLLNTQNYTDSFGQRDFLIFQGVGNSKKLKVLHRGSLGGINAERFNPDRLKDQIEKLRADIFPDFVGSVLLYLGRVNRDKGIKELSEAFIQLKTKYPIKLLIVGPLETLEDKGFNIVIESLKSDSDVKFISFTSEPELYLGLCDIFCFPSYREGFGTVAVEASAMKKPVVASNIYGLSEAVEDRKTGLLFKVHDTNDLIAKLSEVLQDHQFAKQLGQFGRDRVVKDFADKILTEKLVEDYLKMVKQ